MQKNPDHQSSRRATSDHNTYGHISLTAKEIVAARASVAKSPELRSLIGHTTQISMDLSRNAHFAIPTEPGWWHHLYACDLHGCQLIRREANGEKVHLCPVCGKEFATDEVKGSWTQQEHDKIANAARDLAFLDAINPNPAHAASAIRILDHYADIYPQKRLFGKWFAKGRMTGTVLSEATWIIPLTWAADLLHATGRADDAMMQRWFERLFLPCAELLVVQVQITHNIRCWLNAAIACIGYLYSDKDLIFDSVDGYYGFLKQMEKGVTAEGLWFEGSLGYHFYAMQAVLILTEAAKRNGRDLSGNKSFRQMLAISSKVSMPDGRMPSVNDFGYGRKPPLAIMPTMLLQDLSINDRMLAGQRLGDFLRAPCETLDSDSGFVTNWGRFLLDLPQAFSRPVRELSFRWPRSLVMPEAGIGVLRSNKNRQYALLKFGPFGGCHGHFDKPGLLYSWKNHDILIDPGATLYSSPLHQEWYRSTLAHNTFAIDGKRQEPSNGCLIRQSEGLIEVGASPYEGVQAARTVSILENGICDQWEIKCRQTSSIDLIYHFPWPKDMKTKINLASRRVTGNDPAYRYLKKAQVLNGSHQLLYFNGFNVSFSFQASSKPVLIRASTPGISGETCPGLVLILRFQTKQLNASIRIEPE